MLNSRGTIVYIGGMEMPDGNAAAHRVLNNSKIFFELGYHVVFCGMDRFIKTNAKTPIVLNNFESYPMKYPNNGKEWIKQLFDFSHIKFVLDSYTDVRFVVAYNMHAFPLIKVMKYCRKKGIKVITDTTEWYQNRFSLSPIKFIKWLDTSIVMNHLQKKVDGMISISTYLTNYYKKYLKNIIQIPPMVDLEEDIWHQSTDVNSSVRFTYAGLPGRDKDKVGLIVSAYSSIDHGNCIFDVVGITKDQFIADYPEFESILDNTIIFHGRVSHKDSVRFLLQSDYSIFIRDRSRKNMAGFPTKFAECYTSGIGIIANDVSNIRDYYPIENSVILHDSNDLEEIKNAFEKIKETKNETRVLRNEFDFHKFITVMESFLRTLSDDKKDL